MKRRSRVPLYLLAAGTAVVVVAGLLGSLSRRDRPDAGEGSPPTPVVAPVSPGGAALADAARRYIPLADARPFMETLRGHLPGELRGQNDAALESVWPDWVASRDAAIRARVQRGDEDSLVFFWYFGTSFTNLPPVTARNAPGLGGPEAAERMLQQRLDRLLDALSVPGADERVQFARSVVERRGISPSTPAGRAEARRYLGEIRARVVREYDEHQQALRSMQEQDSADALAGFATMYRERGLSSDTSVLAAFAVEQALSDLRAGGVLGDGAVRRAAVVGPGLDFANKDDGYDFYPVQTIQPFALADSLIRLGLASADDLAITTLDLSDRVNQHIESARRKARAGQGYVLHLPLDAVEAWNPELVAYWARAGDRIGRESQAIVPPSSAGRIRVRAVTIPPMRVLSVVPRDLNIVLERLDPPSGMRFDAIVATNILVYYDAFEQALALANIAAMLRPGGILLSNTPVPPTAGMKLSERFTTVSYSARQRDYLFWYTRQ